VDFPKKSFPCAVLRCQNRVPTGNSQNFHMFFHMFFHMPFSHVVLHVFLHVIHDKFTAKFYKFTGLSQTDLTNSLNCHIIFTRVVTRVVRRFVTCVVTRFVERFVICCPRTRCWWKTSRIVKEHKGRNPLFSLWGSGEVTNNYPSFVQRCHNKHL